MVHNLIYTDLPFENTSLVMHLVITLYLQFTEKEKVNLKKQNTITYKETARPETV